ncbi:hypothetical protein NON20_02470 [Synechocystis sp. B12]|nr:hypothetical protein NON20_02470 [Synechocystis sp. B12]
MNFFNLSPLANNLSLQKLLQNRLPWAVIVLFPLVFVGCTTRRTATVTLSTGNGLSAYVRIGKQIQESAATVDLVVVDNKDSQGSQQNLQRLLDGEVDFAMVQLDVASEAMKAGDVAAVAILTEEYAHIVGAKIKM